jgi:hypothetical protein
MAAARYGVEIKLADRPAPLGSMRRAEDRDRVSPWRIPALKGSDPAVECAVLGVIGVLSGRRSRVPGVGPVAQQCPSRAL